MTLALEIVASILILIRVACLAWRVDRHEWRGRMLRYAGWVVVFSFFFGAAFGNLYIIFSGEQEPYPLVTRLLTVAVCLHMVLDMRPPVGTPPALWRQLYAFFLGGEPREPVTRK